VHYEDIAPDEIKALFIELIKRAYRDLMRLDKDSFDFQTAYDFIYTDDYSIYFDEFTKDDVQKEDGFELPTEQIFELLDFNQEYFRDKIKQDLYNVRRPVACELFGPL